MHKTGLSSVQISLMGYDDGETFYARFSEQSRSLPIHTVFLDHPELFRHWTKPGYCPDDLAEWPAHYREVFAEDLQRCGLKEASVGIKSGAAWIAPCKWG